MLGSIIGGEEKRGGGGIGGNYIVEQVHGAVQLRNAAMQSDNCYTEPCTCDS